MFHFKVINFCSFYQWGKIRNWLSFCAWLILLNKISISSSIHVNQKQWMVCHSFTACIQRFIFSSMDGYLAWCHTLPIDSAASNMICRYPFTIFISISLDLSISGVVGLYVNCILNFFLKKITVLIHFLPIQGVFPLFIFVSMLFLVFCILAILVLLWFCFACPWLVMLIMYIHLFDICITSFKKCYSYHLPAFN